MSVTTDPNDPRLGHGADEKQIGQNEVYLVLSEEERTKGFVRPLRYSYTHVGLRPKYTLRDLTEKERELYASEGYVKFEIYPEDSRASGKFWTQVDLDNYGCGAITSMGQAIAETYARSPNFYGATYCTGCKKHLPVNEFVWTDDETKVGS